MKQELITFLEDLRDYGQKESIPNVTPAGGQFLNTLIKIANAQQILEIGCANGYSTIWLADAAQTTGGHITTIDHSAPSFEEAKINLKKASLDHRVSFKFGRAQNLIPTFELKYDFVFVDAQKKHYLELWEIIQPRLAPKATIVFDDMLAFQHKTGPLKAHLEKANIPHQILPIDKKDGVMLIHLQK